MDSTENVPAKIQAEAKARALAVLNSDPNCISYVRPEDLETSALFIPIVSIIKPTKDDFYAPIPGIGIMAKPMLVNLICEKWGISITRTETSKRGQYVWVAHCFGERQLADGTKEYKDASYEFDAETRAELDSINQPNKYGTAIEKRKHLLETAKFGEQRAVTGAQHALIHKLAKCARSFKTPEELLRGMKTIRYDRNVNGVLADPHLRDAFALNAFGAGGAKDQVFGPQKQIPHTVDVPSGEMIPQPEGELPLDTFEDDEAPAAEPAPAPEPTPLENARAMLEGYREKIKVLPPGAMKKLDTMLAKKDATIDEFNALIDRFTAALQAKKEGAA